MKKRYHEVDSIRGVAALTVLFSHFMLVYNCNFLDTQNMGLNVNWYKYTPFHVFWAGSEAVILFFILSGFVLFLPFSKQKGFSYSIFVTKRIFRIYPASIVAILVAVFLYLIANGNTRAIDSIWINSMWTKELYLPSLISDVFLVGYGGSGLNPVLWSLVHEIRLSFLFPIIAVIIIKYDWKKVLLGTMIVSLMAFVIMTKYSASNTDVISTLFYSGTFVVGGLLAKYRNSLIARVNRCSSIGKLLMLLIAINLYVFGWIINNQLVIHNNYVIIWSTTIGASIFIILSLTSVKISNILKINAIQFLGKISYSLYLYHMIFLLFFLKMNVGVSVSIKLLLTFVISIIVSTISYKFIEKPMIKLGTKVMVRFRKVQTVKSKNVENSL